MSDVQDQITEVNQKFDMFFKLYHALGSALNGLPINPALISNIRYSMDTGFLWVKECLTITQNQLHQAAQAEMSSGENAPSEIIVAPEAQEIASPETIQ